MDAPEQIGSMESDDEEASFVESIASFQYHTLSDFARDLSHERVEFGLGERF